MIPPGRESFVSDMLGKGQPLCPACKFAGALIERDRIKTRFDCGASPVVVELRHPSASQGAASRTDRFAIHVASGNAPAGLIDALAARIRSKESEWSWGPEPSAAPEPRPQASTASPQPAPPTRTPWPWILPIAAIFLAAGCWRLPRPARQDWLIAAAVGGAALIARVAFGPWGPFHANGQGPLWVMGAAWDPSLLYNYGPGYAELFSALTRLAPARPDDVIFATNGLLSACVSAIAYAMARLAGLDRVRACLAASLLAIDPIAIRMATTESYLVPILLLTAAASLALMGATARLAAGERGPAACLAIAGSLLCAQAIRVHPYGWTPAAACVLAGFAVDHGKGLRGRLLWTAACCGVAGVVVLAVDGSVLRLVAAHALQEGGRIGLVHLRPHSILEPPTIALAFGLAVAAFAARPRWVVVPAACTLAAMALTHHFHSQSWFQHAALQRVFSPILVIGVMSALPGRWFERRSARVVALASVVALLVVFLPAAKERTTEHLEYRWLRDRFASLPPDCVVAYIARADRRVLYLPEYRAAGRSRSRPLTIEIAKGEQLRNTFLAGQCAFVLRASICTSSSGRPPCDELERGVNLSPVERATFPALATHIDDPYDRPSVEVVLSRAVDTPGRSQ